ncbi:hypothetical protein M5K25_023181 [Dendrobium thyrsiflorum]|uniref:Uncharacterized protein n=1 Tax=Dendrobium thyrsiflorum TaxID=117978 RepID=A0ABD0UEH2_DENTH
MLVSAYEGFLHVRSDMVQGSGFVRMEDISAMLSLIFDDGSGKDGRRREKKDADEMMASASASASAALPGRERRKGRRRTTRYTALQFGNEEESSGVGDRSSASFRKKYLIRQGFGGFIGCIVPKKTLGYGGEIMSSNWSSTRAQIACLTQPVAMDASSRAAHKT